MSRGYKYFRKYTRVKRQLLIAKVVQAALEFALRTICTSVAMYYMAR